jgi:glycosyltransferase involved in cell wall biosynthesis
MKVSVVIPAYNEEKYLEECLQSILDQTDKPDEIIVVDNNCTDKTVEIAKKYNARVVTEAIQGMIPARNKGYDCAKYEIIARTDSDTHVPKNWIELIKENFAKDKDLLGLSGPASFYNFPISDKLQHSQWENKAIFAIIKSRIGHDTLYGPNIAIRKSAWEKVRNEVCLDDKAVHEDTDLAIHLGRIGKIRIDPKLIVRTSFRRYRNLPNYLIYSRKMLNTFRIHNLKKIIPSHNVALYNHDVGGPINTMWKEFRPKQEISPDTMILYLPGWSIGLSSKPVEELCEKLTENLNIKIFALHTKPKNIKDNSLFYEAEALKKLVQKLNPTIKKVVLMSHSQGTVKTIHLAHMLWKDLSYEVKGIICITPVGLYKLSKRGLQIKFLGEVVRALYGSLKEILHKNKSTTDLVKSIASYVKNEIKERKLYLYKKRVSQQAQELASSHPIMIAKLQEIKSKIAFILADKDFISSTARIKRALDENNMQNIKILENKDTTHGLPYLQTEILVAEIEDLVKDFLHAK